MKIWSLILSFYLLYINCKKKEQIPKEYELLYHSQLCGLAIQRLMDIYSSDVDELITRGMEINEDLGEKESKNLITEMMILNCINSLNDSQYSLLNDYRKSNIKNFDIKPFEKNLKFDNIKEILNNNDTQKINDYLNSLNEYKEKYVKQLEDLQDAKTKNILAKEGDEGIFGSKLKNNKWMNIIGIISMIIIAIGLGYLYYKIRNMNVKKKKKKH